MPNISFDIFFNEDTVNLTASRSQHAPKVKPAWKTRTAPKLEPRTPKTPGVSVFAPGVQTSSPRLQSASVPGPRVEELADSKPTSVAPKPKLPAKAAPKLKDLPGAAKATPGVVPQKAPPKLNTTPKTPVTPAAPAPKKNIPKLKDQGKAGPAKLNTNRTNRFDRTVSESST